MSRPSLRVSKAYFGIIAALASAGCSGGADRSQPPAAAAETVAASTIVAANTNEDFRSFTIGELSAIALHDGALAFPNDTTVFGIGQSPRAVAALLEAAGAPSDSLHASIQPLLVKTSDRVLLFDTGAGTNLGPGAGHLATAMAAAGIDPRSVTDIFISHAHGDHVGGLVNAAGSLVFPNATIHLSAPEWKFLTGMGSEAARNSAIARHDELVAAITPRIATFAPGSDILPGVVKAVEIAGHTPGHSGYLITSGRSSLLYIGDALHHYVVSVQRPSWLNGFDADRRTAAASRVALLERSAASGQRLYAIHLPFPGIGRVEKRGDGFVWMPE